jgi:hypothetical protein
MTFSSFGYLVSEELHLFIVRVHVEDSPRVMVLFQGVGFADLRVARSP